MRIVLVRHGESVVTVNRMIGGLKSCTGLSPLGHRQAEALGDRLRRTGELAHADAIVVSTMPRAIETAERVAAALPDVSLTQDAAWCEHDPGEVDGMTFEDYVQRFGNPDWDDPFATHFPGGESLMAFHDRVRGALARLVAERQGQSVVVVCHGGVIDAAFRTLLQLPLVGGFELHTKNTSLTEVERIRNRWKLVRYNDAAHLEGLPAETARA
jgi:2,3-bisphosphoglycerate-dependent phosphoglycerate mutase